MTGTRLTTWPRDSPNEMGRQRLVHAAGPVAHPMGRMSMAKVSHPPSNGKPAAKAKPRQSVKTTFPVDPIELAWLRLEGHTLRQLDANGDIELVEKFIRDRIDEKLKAGRVRVGMNYAGRLLFLQILIRIAQTVERECSAATPTLADFYPSTTAKPAEKGSAP
jgi:hypothetical protein